MHSLPVRFDDEGDTRTRDDGLESSSMDECGLFPWPNQDNNSSVDELPEQFCEQARGKLKNIACIVLTVISMWGMVNDKTNGQSKKH